MEPKQSHTPTPWFTSSDNRGIIVGGKRLGMMNIKENTSFVVRAVNCHEELVGNLRALLKETSVTLPTYKVQAIEALIAKAEAL